MKTTTSSTERSVSLRNNTATVFSLMERNGLRGDFGPNGSCPKTKDVVGWNERNPLRRPTMGTSDILDLTRLGNSSELYPSKARSFKRVPFLEKYHRVYSFATGLNKNEKQIYASKNNPFLKLIYTKY